MTDIRETDTLIIGGGHAGLATSRCLQQRDVPHRVLERDRIGASWRTRWDSFVLNTPNQITTLPDMEALGPDDAFTSRDAWVDQLERYRAAHALPVEEGVEVSSIRRQDDAFWVETDQGTWRARHVVLCTGDQNVPRWPALAEDLPDDIVQLHTADYRSPEDLPEGAVLVVGSGQSGAQITEDLLEAGRKVWLCTSAVGRAPRRYRGRDITSWVSVIGIGEQRPEDVDPSERAKRQGLISGTRGGHSISLQQLAREGAYLLGRMVGVRGRTIHVDDGLRAHVELGNQASRQLRVALDGVIAKAGIVAPAAAPDPADAPFDALDEMAAVRALELDDAGIRSVVWATGFRGDYGFLPPGWLDEDGRPRQRGGEADVEGLFCVGLQWGRRRVSALIFGATDDAAWVADRIASAQ